MPKAPEQKCGRSPMAEKYGERLRRAVARHSGKPVSDADTIGHDPELGRRIGRLKELLDRLKPVPASWLGLSEENGDALVTRRLSAVCPKPVAWLWDNRVPLGKLTIIQGDPEKGKTWVVLDLISHVTTGKSFGDGAPCGLAEALFVTAEDGIADTIRPRLDLLRANANRVYSLDVVRAGKREVALDLDRHLALLDTWLSKHPLVRVVALDPLAAFLGRIDSHRNSDVRGVLGRLSKLAENRNVAVIAINHLTKGVVKAIHRSIGSIAFVAAARAVWQVSSDADDPGRRLFLPVKMNLSKTSGLAFSITDNGLVWESGSIDLSPDDVEVADGETPRGEAKDWLRDLLRLAPVAAKDIERQANQDGICMRTLKYAKKELGIESKRNNGMWSWCLPKKVKP